MAPLSMHWKNVCRVFLSDIYYCFLEFVVVSIIWYTWQLHIISRAMLLRHLFLRFFSVKPPFIFSILQLHCLVPYILKTRNKLEKSWNHLEWVRMSWNYLKQAGITWNKLELNGTNWNDIHQQTDTQKKQKILRKTLYTCSAIA